MKKHQEVAQLFKEKGNIVAFTGAGISVDAGIPAFRGGQGLWEKYDPMEYAHIQSFLRYPDKVWTMLREMGDVILGAQPSPAHRALAALEKAGLLNAVITQNVDGLHQAAGNRNVIEYHGNHRRLICPGCSTTSPFTEESNKVIPYPRCDRCEEVLKPDVVFFGEEIPRTAMIRANHEANNCKVMLIIGTSGVVYPAADIPFMASSNGAKVVEINVSPTPFTSAITHHFIEGSASDILPGILEELGLESA
ncbi:MAG: NAD-dependent protein deacetylase [Syntrophorhabdaceae bacterium PtaU1.Bin034]|nr:MAG: NAD-dependent protein deacetylase [Syntrophorhabdaceae bacterium PtaU1.Bin034]